MIKPNCVLCLVVELEVVVDASVTVAPESAEIPTTLPDPVFVPENKAVDIAEALNRIA